MADEQPSEQAAPRRHGAAQRAARARPDALGRRGAPRRRHDRASPRGRKPRVRGRVERRAGRPRRRAPGRGDGRHPARQARAARGAAALPGRAVSWPRRWPRRSAGARCAARRRAASAARPRSRRSRSCPRSSRCAAASSPRTTASSTRRSPPTSTTTPTRATPPRSTTAAARTSMAPLLAANLAGAALLRRTLERPSKLADAAVSARVGRRGGRGLRLVRAPRRQRRRARAAPARPRAAAAPRHARADRAPARGRPRRARRDPARRGGRRVTGALHVTNGDCARGGPARERPGRGDPAWRDVLHEGPAPAVGPTSCDCIRAALPGRCRRRRHGRARGPGAARPEARGSPRRRVRPVVRGRPLRPAADRRRSSRRSPSCGVAPARITLICIGEYPGHRPLRRPRRADPAAAPWAARGRPPTHADRAPRSTHATRAWAALRAPEPTAPGRDRREPATRAALRRRGLRPPQPRVPVHPRRRSRSPSGGSWPAVADGRRHARARLRATRRRARPGRSWATRGASTPSIASLYAPVRSCSRTAHDGPLASHGRAAAVLDGEHDRRRGQRHRPLDRRACTCTGTSLRGAGTRATECGRRGSGH